MTPPTVLGLCVLVACVACVIGYVVGRAFGECENAMLVCTARFWAAAYRQLLCELHHEQRHRLTTIYVPDGANVIDALTGTSTTSPEPEL